MKTSFSSSSFRSTFNNSIRIDAPNITFRVLTVKNSQDVKLGFLVNKTLGPAYKRGLFKRRIRSLFDSYFIKKNYKISIIIKPKSINLSWKELISSFDLLTKNLNGF